MGALALGEEGMMGFQGTWRLGPEVPSYPFRDPAEMGSAFAPFTAAVSPREVRKQGRRRKLFGRACAQNYEAWAAAAARKLGYVLKCSEI